jgi:GTP-binding protein EngB required for normal cell division
MYIKFLKIIKEKLHLGYCEKEEHNWRCEKCSELLDYDFDGSFYCSCGRAPAESFRFKCKSENHGQNFLQFSVDDLKKSLDKMRPVKEMNILILGETGVGKSTWINAIANYLTYSSLEEAKQNELLSLIGASFTITDKQLKERVIKIGNFDNESQIAGESATQEPRVYSFPWKDFTVRLIDTPGIGDTRGIEEDKKNFDSILKYLSNFDELHGICILLKPNNAKLNVMFKFCIKELLTHLHRSAKENIVFCFTNARGSDYGPGDTYVPLKKLLSENKEVEIALTTHNVYCMDNESFRFLCEINNEVPYDDKKYRTFSESWDISVEEFIRLINHISSLKPHSIKDTTSLNYARRVILNLTKPLAEISRNIQLNISVIKDRKNEILNSKKREEELLKDLYIPMIAIEAVPLGYPKTVCTNAKCVKYRTIEDKKIIEYVTVCHEHCLLEGVLAESYPNADLKRCSAMDKNLNCTECKCSWDQHMHFPYEQKQVSKHVIDESVQDMINSKKNARKAIEQHIKTLENNIKELEEEQEIISKTSAKFGSFLKSNAIVPYNDALVQYIQHLIEEERKKSPTSGELKGLEDMLECYQKEVDILEGAMKRGQNVEILTPDDIKNLEERLYSLKHKGKELEKYMKVAMDSISKMTMAYTETSIKTRRGKIQSIIQKGKHFFKDTAVSFGKKNGSL